MATVQHGGTLPDSSDKDDFYAIIDEATVTGILDADIDAGAAISDTKLATISTAGKVNVTALTGQISSTNLSQIVTPGKVSGAALTLLGNIPANAGIIPSANLPFGGGGLGDWVSKSNDTTYQADTNGFVIGVIFVDSHSCSAHLIGYTDNNSSPSTIRCGAHYYSSSITQRYLISSFCMPVKKDDYWKADFVNEAGTDPTVNVYWIPVGS